MMWKILFLCLYEMGDLLVNPPAVSPSVEVPRNRENALVNVYLVVNTGHQSFVQFVYKHKHKCI